MQAISYGWLIGSYVYAEMPTSPILSYLVRQTEQNTIILFCLSKYDFPPMSVFRSLSLFFLCISYQTITLVWHFISLLSSGKPYQNKFMTEYIHYLPRSHSVAFAHCTVLYCARTVFIMIVPRISRTYIWE